MQRIEGCAAIWPALCCRTQAGTAGDGPRGFERLPAGRLAGPALLGSSLRARASSPATPQARCRSAVVWLASLRESWGGEPARLELQVRAVHRRMVGDWGLMRGLGEGGRLALWHILTR